MRKRAPGALLQPLRRERKRRVCAVRGGLFQRTIRPGVHRGSCAFMQRAAGRFSCGGRGAEAAAIFRISIAAAAKTAYTGMVAVHPWRAPNEGAQWDGTEQESRAPALADGRGQMMANGDQAMKRKFASMFMNPAYRPELHQAVFETAHQDTHIFTVRDFEEAVALAQRLVEEGFGALEVCGAFRPDQVRAPSRPRTTGWPSVIPPIFRSRTSCLRRFSERADKTPAGAGEMAAKCGFFP